MLFIFIFLAFFFFFTSCRHFVFYFFLRYLLMLVVCVCFLFQAALYSVRWYFGTEEFYRYVPKEAPPTLVFPVSGINVDVSYKLVFLCFCFNILVMHLRLYTGRSWSQGFQMQIIESFTQFENFQPQNNNFKIIIK